MSEAIPYQYNDGGRKASGFKGYTGDCAVRAIAIAAGIPYRVAYDEMNLISKLEQTKRRSDKISSARDGVYRKTMDKVMKNLGFVWTPTMGVGTGCRVHLRTNELPSGRIVVALSKHYAAVVNGVLHDIYDCSREGTRCVYGYYKLEGGIS